MAALGEAAGGKGGFEFDPRFFPTKPHKSMGICIGTVRYAYLGVVVSPTAQYLETASSRRRQEIRTLSSSPGLFCIM